MDNSGANCVGGGFCDLNTTSFVFDILLVVIVGSSLLRNIAFTWGGMYVSGDLIDVGEGRLTIVSACPNQPYILPAGNSGKVLISASAYIIGDERITTLFCYLYFLSLWVKVKGFCNRYPIEVFVCSVLDLRRLEWASI